MMDSLKDIILYCINPYKHVLKYIQKLIFQGAQLERLIFPINSLGHIYIYQFSYVSIKHNRLISGLGYAEDENEALIKAFFEYYERLALFNDGSNNFNNTNGLACHIFRSLAKENAINELYERDSILQHWYQQYGFEEVTSDKITIENFSKIKQELTQLGYTVKFALTKLGYKKTVCCFVINENNGFTLGSSASDNNPYKKAFYESLINLFFGHQGFSEQELISRIEQNGVLDLLDHRSYWLYFKKMPQWIFDRNAKHQLTNISKLSSSPIIYFELAKRPYCIAVKQKGVLDLTCGPFCPNSKSTQNASTFHMSNIIHPIA